MKSFKFKNTLKNRIRT